LLAPLQVDRETDRIVEVKMITRAISQSHYGVIEEALLFNIEGNQLVKVARKRQDWVFDFHSDL
jgi:hypothetical protein